MKEKTVIDVIKIDRRIQAEGWVVVRKESKVMRDECSCKPREHKGPAAGCNLPVDIFCSENYNRTWKPGQVLGSPLGGVVLRYSGCSSDIIHAPITVLLTLLLLICSGCCRIVQLSPASRNVFGFITAGRHQVRADYVIAAGSGVVVLNPRDPGCLSQASDNCLSVLKAAFPEANGWSYVKGRRLSGKSLVVRTYVAEHRPRTSVGAEFHVEYVPHGKDPQQNVHWIQIIRNNHDGRLHIHGRAANQVDIQNPAGSTPYYDDGYAADANSLYDRPFRSDDNRDHSWSAETYLVTGPAPGGRPGKIEIHGGVRWGWKNSVRSTVAAIAQPPVNSEKISIAIKTDQEWKVAQDNAVHNSISIALVITNQGTKNLSFMKLDTVSFSLENSEGKRILGDRLRDGIRPGRPVSDITSPGSSASLPFKGTLKQQDNALELVIEDEFGTVWHFSRLTPGPWRLSAAYENDITNYGQINSLWTGRVESPKVEVIIR